VLFFWQFGDEGVVAFATDNMLSYPSRARLLSTMIVAAAGVGLVATAYMVVTGIAGVVAIRRLSRLLAPLTLLGLVPALLVPPTWDAASATLAIAAFTLLFERLLRVSLRELASISGSSSEDPLTASAPALSSRRRRWGGLVVTACALFYGVYMSIYTVYSHRRFGTYGFDLGQYDNIFWSTLHGRPLRCAPLNLFENWHELANHAELSVFFLLPFYAIRPNAETLLIIQAFVLGLGAIPLYLFAVRRLPPIYAAALSICYLLYPPMHGANFYDFHFQPVAGTFVLFTIYFVDARRWILAAIAFVVALGCREDISVGLALLGAYLVLSGYRPRAGAIMTAAGVAYFAVMRFYIMPRLGPTWFADIYKELYPQPNGPHSFAGVMQTLMTNPFYVFRTLLTAEKLRYFLQIAVPLALLPLRRSYLLPALVPGAIFTLLTTAYSATTDIGFQYSGHFTPYVFAASALMLAAYRAGRHPKIKLRAATAAVAMGTFLCTLHWGAFPPGGVIRSGFANVSFTPPRPADVQKGRDLKELDAMIPPEATVAVSEQEMPHVSGRLNVLTLKYATNSADYILYGHGSMGADVASKAVVSGEYVELAQRPGLGLLKRNR
jgi:uncharacterized membrane protein